VTAERTEIVGIGVSPGWAVGPLVHLPDARREPVPGVAVPESERAASADRIETAAEKVKASLETLASQATGDARAILEATALMAADPTLIRAAVEKAARGLSPERAVWEAVDEVAATLRSAGGVVAARVRDLEDVRDRLVDELTGHRSPSIPQSAEPFVLVARDLAPADTATLDPSRVRALVTAEGGEASHTAIIARALGLPAVVAGPSVLELREGTVVLVDGDSGVVRPHPRPEDVAELAASPRVRRRFRGTGATRDGRAVALLANVGDPRSAVAAAEAGAEGVGLFRTEFCFLHRAAPPSVAEQVSQYEQVFAAFPGKRVIVRTLDAGADKPLGFLSGGNEPNPALGMRGWRVFRRAPGVLRDQLEAVAAAASHTSADVWVMAPMVATVAEAREFVTLCDSYRLTTAGVMIETPSAAVCAAEIFEYAKFGSIGTNDLTQYVMAADRSLGELSNLATAWQPAVLRMIRSASEGAAVHQRPVGVCGEAAADPAMACVLVGLGVTSLSMSATAIPAVADVLANVSYDECVALAHEAVAAASPDGAREAVRRRVPFPGTGGC
jgi:phosphoenolpyruvate-protein phosphotransferase (PTS system enzyme I)